MKEGIEIETERLILRHWRPEDLEDFHFLNSDRRVMTFFPKRFNRNGSSKLIKVIQQIVQYEGFYWAAMTLGETRQVIGLIGLAKVLFKAPFTPTVEIGWRLHPDHWGNGYASEAAGAMLRHGFCDLDLDVINAFAVKGNRPSINVMERIGMTPVPENDFFMPGIPHKRAHLRPHVFYTISKNAWMEHCSTKKAAPYKVSSSVT